MDLTLCFIGLLVLMPVFAVISFLLVITQGRPVLFTQPRIGFRGRVFHLYKFRTMRPLKEGENPHGMDRLTTVGKFIRSLSLDELPSLINVIKGEMSLVGPRPLLVHYRDRYTDEQMKRHDVLPGLTGWAQVNGRNTISWEDKFKHDVWYAKHSNLWLDLKIIFLTFKILIWREGINASQTDVSEEFDPGLYVIGAGGHAKVVISTLDACGMKVMGVFDDNQELKGRKILGVPVIGTLAEIKNHKVKKAVIGIGSNVIREKIAKSLDLNWISVVHPTAVIHPSVEIGAGTVVFARSVIQPDTKIGKHVIINSGVIVEHDSKVDDFSHLCPGSILTGGVVIGWGALIGAGSKVIPYKKIGRQAVIGAGSVVINDVEDFSTVVGVPAAVTKNTLQIQRKNA